MSEKTNRSFWNLRPLGSMTREERACFYDELDDDGVDHFFLSDKESHLYENPRFELAILEDDGTVVPAQGYTVEVPLRDTEIDVFLERYYAAAMPGRNYELQLAITSRHIFSGRQEKERVAHTLAVKGVIGDYANYLTEPVFRNLAIEDTLTLDIAVNFISDKITRRLLSVMDNEALEKGVQLASTFNPVFGTVATYAKGIVKMSLESKQNANITDAHLSFTADTGNLSASLIEGTYLLFQPTSDEKKLSLKNARYDLDNKTLVVDGNPAPRNHMFLRLKRSR